jgi:hypothetical protein
MKAAFAHVIKVFSITQVVLLGQSAGSVRGLTMETKKRFLHTPAMSHLPHVLGVPEYELPVRCPVEMARSPDGTVCGIPYSGEHVAGPHCVSVVGSL